MSNMHEIGAFVLKWSAGNLAGGLFGALLFIPFLASDDPTHKGIAGALVGLGLGLGQGLVLRRHLAGPIWWVLATLVGFAVGGSLLGVGTDEELARRGLSTETVGLVLGTASGIAQWTVLRLRSLRAMWWIPANTAAFGLGWYVTLNIDFGLDYNSPLSPIVGAALILLPFALISGSTLWWILNASTPNQPSSQTG
jgi:hypothetical protein